MRVWAGRENDDGSLHCMGNGKMCAYGQGPDIVQLFGPPYSSPSLISILLQGENISANSSPIDGTAIWTHLLKNSNQENAEISDFVDADTACFCRRIRSDFPLKFSVILEKDVLVVDNGELFSNRGFTGGYLFYSKAGAYFYNDYPLNKKIYFQLLLSGGMRATNKDGTIEISAEKGPSELYMIGGDEYPDCCVNVEKAIKTGFDAMYRQTEDFWKKFSAGKKDFSGLAKPGTPLKSEYLGVLNSVPVLIKAQQSVEGGVLAGHRYHMAFVRDQYGVFRCLLKLGYFEEAKNILLYYWHIWKKEGRICNAQSMGEPIAFHIHENEDVEITGYIILQSFDFLKATGDESLLREILPMLLWAFNAQKKHLVNGMLPFNGDETYVAGGVLPRNALNDGSAEATMLFITSGEKLVNWLSKNQLYKEDELKEDRKLLADTRAKYHDNFFKNGSLIANNPERKKGLKLPAFRHGPCEGCLLLTGDKPFSFGWNEKNENDRYLCPSCKANNQLGRAEDISYHIQSVSLVPLYISSDLLTTEEISALVEQIITQYKKNGKLPSRPDGNITVGYDYGLLLYTLTELHHPLAEEIYHKTMATIDPAGAWVEYYYDGVPSRTRCRAWESGINLEAVINYLEKNS